VDVTFDHFAELETEKQASAMTIFRAESLPTVKDGKAQFIFSPIDGGKFAVGGTQCTFSTQEFSLVSAGSKESAEIRKRYIALCSFTEGVQDVGHAAVARAAVAVSLHNDVYITNFRKALEEEWKISPANRSELNVSFKEPEACVDYPSRVEGWDIISSSSPCILPEENVDFPKPEDLSLYDYPPRVVFEMTPSVNSKPCILQFKLTGMNKDINFRIPLRETKRRMTISVGATERPCLKDLMHLSTREGKDIRIIEESATSYCQIGTILLEDKRGNKVDTILHDAGGKMTETITEVYKKWMKEDPNYSWMKLTQCFRECSLNSLASDIEQHFGILSPLESRADTTCTESDLARMQGDKILLVTPKDEQPSATDGTQRNQCRCC
jgi:hypothetical protein